MRRQRAWGPGARAALGPGGGAHSRLQYGVSKNQPPDDRRIRSAVPQSWRRRRYLLAAAGSRRHVGIQPSRRGLAMLSAAGLVWGRLRFALPILTLAAVAPILQAGLGAARASFSSGPRSRLTSLKLRGLTAVLHLLYSAARLWGRLRHGLAPWRRHGGPGLSLRRRRSLAIWTERWQAAEQRLQELELAVRGARVPVVRGGPYDRWDLQARGGMLGAVRILMAIEEHGAGRQLVRVRLWPRYSPGAVVLIILVAGLSISAAIDHAIVAAALFGALAGLLALRALHETASVAAAVRSALARVKLDKRPLPPSRRQLAISRYLRRRRAPSRELRS